MKTRIYTIFYKYDANQIEWHDLETDFTEEEVEKKLRQLRRDYPGMTFRKAFSREAEMQTVVSSSLIDKVATGLGKNTCYLSPRRTERM